MNNTFASISLNFVGDNNDSTIITFLSLGATRACLKTCIINTHYISCVIHTIKLWNIIHITCKIVNE